MALTDAAVMIGKEGTYGTAATLTNQIEAKTDGWKRSQTLLKRRGFRAAQKTERSAGSRTVNLGGEGGLELDVLTNGMGIILESMFSAVAGPTQQGGTTAYTQTYTLTKDGPSTSLTVQLLRPKMETGVEDFTYLGCVCKGWEFTCDAGEDNLLKMKAEYDLRDSNTATAAGTPGNLLPTRDATATVFSWDQGTVEIDTVAITTYKKLSLKADHGLNIDRRYIQGSALKKQPRRSKLPVYTGMIEGDFTALTDYAAFVAGTPVQIEFIFTGAAISGGGGATYLFHFTMPECIYTGDTPQMSLEDDPVQSLPFEVLDDGTNSPITLVVHSDDETLTGVDA